MPKFKKPIVSAGVFLVGNDAGTRHTEVITSDRLLHWAKQFKRMRKAGIATPAPWSHTKEAMPVRMGNDGTLARADWNAGFWEEFTVEPNEQGVATLFGIVDAPGSETDPNTPAGKIGKTVRETSIYARPSFTDGKGQTYEDAIMHVALVTHPIEPGQGNFKPLTLTDATKDGMTIAMSHCQSVLMSADYTPFSQQGSDNPSDSDDDDDAAAAENAPTGDLKAIIDFLKKVGVILPKDTTEENLKERLSVALQQKIAGEEEEEDEDVGTITKPPKEAEEESATTIMATTPATPAPIEITAEVIMAHPAYVALKGQNDQLFNVMNKQARDARGRRINALISSGRVTKKFADETLVPMLSGFKMSFGADGQETLTALDVTLAALEASDSPVTPKTPDGTPGLTPNSTLSRLAPFLMSSIAPEGSDIPNHPQGGFHTDGVLNDEEAETVGDTLCKNLGL